MIWISVIFIIDENAVSIPNEMQIIGKIEQNWVNYKTCNFSAENMSGFIISFWQQGLPPDRRAGTL